MLERFYEQCLPGDPSDVLEVSMEILGCSRATYINSFFFEDTAKAKRLEKSGSWYQWPMYVMDVIHLCSEDH